LSATLIKTDYRIDIFAVVAARDTVCAFYAEGVGKVLVGFSPRAR
jgi:hypothetical protein